MKLNFVRILAFGVFVCFLINSIAADSALAAEPFEVFLKKHCVRCHGSQKEEGDIRIDRLSRDFKAGLDSHHWAEVLDKINSGEMPPKMNRSRLRTRFSVRPESRLAPQGRAGSADGGTTGSAHYRLSRKEYQNTVYDLLGVRYDPAKPGELNEDTLWHGFERIGAQLSLSPSHVDRYYRAADIVLDRAFPATSSEARKVRKTAPSCVTAAGRNSRRRWIDSASSARCVISCSPAESSKRFLPTGSERRARNTAGSIACVCRPAVSVHPVANRLI